MRNARKLRLSEQLQALMQVQLGLANVTQAARALGISRRHFYRMQERLLDALREVVLPRRRGRRPKVVDPKIRDLEAKLEDVLHEKDLLSIKVKNLEEVLEVLRRVQDQGGRGKKGPGSGGSRRARSTLHGGAQAGRAGFLPQRPPAGKNPPGDLPGNGRFPMDPGPMGKSLFSGPSGPEGPS